jgi:hypothetical protein
MITRTYDGGVGCPSNPGDEKRYGCETSKRQWQRERLLDPATLIPLLFIGVVIAITALAFCLFAFVLWLSRSLVRHSGRSVQIDSEGLHPTEQWESCSLSDCQHGRFPDNLKQTGRRMSLSISTMPKLNNYDTERNQKLVAIGTLS